MVMSLLDTFDPVGQSREGRPHGPSPEFAIIHEYGTGQPGQGRNSELFRRWPRHSRFRQDGIGS